MPASAAFISVSFVVSGVPACMKWTRVEFVCSYGPSKPLVTWTEAVPVSGGLLVPRLSFLTVLTAERQPCLWAGWVLSCQVPSVAWIIFPGCAVILDPPHR